MSVGGMAPGRASDGPGGPPAGSPPASTDLLSRVAEVYLALLPAAQLHVMVVGGAVAAAADLALAVLLLAGAADLVGRRGRGAPEAWLPRPVGTALALLALYGVWAALSGTWGPHATYAGAKGLGIVALAGGAAALAASRAGWGRLADAWLVGAALALTLALVGWALGPETLRLRVLYTAGAVEGLPFPRIRGPFLHPTMAAEYWAVTGAVLWARWPALEGARRTAATALAAALAAALLLAVSTGWIAAGAGLLVLARSGGARSGPALAARVGGLALMAGGLAGVLVPLAVELGPLSLRTGAIRPTIWASALRAVVEAPLMGVGAAPYLAQAPDPLGGGAVSLWDAHNTYLSLLGQFGLVGAGLALGGAVVLAGALMRARPSRVRTGLLAALAVVAVHGLFAAGEDFRHVWALLGVVGAWVGEEGRGTEARRG